MSGELDAAGTAIEGGLPGTAIRLMILSCFVWIVLKLFALILLFLGMLG